MKFINKYILLQVVFILSVSLYSQETDDISIIKNNFYDIYVKNEFNDYNLKKTLIEQQPGYDVSDRVAVELQQLVPTSDERMNKYLQTLKADGSWEDIDYNNRNRSGWEPRLHAERILEMVIAYRNDKSMYHNSVELENAIHKSMKFWFDAKLKCTNWWYNQIGVPRTLGTAFVLFKDNMSDIEIEDTIEIMENSKIGMTGQNKVWLASNVMMRGVLENDDSLIKEARDCIVSEITTGNKEGIKDDWCFHQHGSQQQFGNYGLAYVYTMSLISGVLYGTSLEFTKEQIDIIASLIEKGYQWIIWNGKMDINALGRQLFISAPVHKALSMAIAASKLGGDDYGCKETAEAFIANCFSGKNELTGMYHFWQSDYSICRRKKWMASLKMASKRVIGTENMNGDNMKGYYMADGAMYVYKDSDEYLDIFPLWDWRKLPGVTCYDDSIDVPVLKEYYKPGNDESFVGGLTDGNCGISSMHLNRDGLKAYKTWVFDDSMIICLGSGIKSDSALNVTTSVEQCWAKGSIRKIIKSDCYNDSFSESVRIFHNKTGYILWDALDKYKIERRSTEGKWHDIMTTYSEDKKISGDTFSVYINHGKSPDGASYCYAIIPYVDYQSFKDLDISDIEILKNDEDIQAVWFKDRNICWASVISPTVLNLKPDISLEFMTTGLYKISMKDNNVEIMFADPTQSLEETVVNVNGNSFSRILPQREKSGTSVNLVNVQ